jgi:ankyrin repeat protein
MKLLIENHCVVNGRSSKESTALILATQKGFSECTKVLIENGCDVNVRTNTGDTALILAASYRVYETTY